MKGGRDFCYNPFFLKEAKDMKPPGDSFSISGWGEKKNHCCLPLLLMRKMDVSFARVTSVLYSSPMESQIKKFRIYQVNLYGNCTCMRLLVVNAHRASSSWSRKCPFFSSKGGKHLSCDSKIWWHVLRPSQSLGELIQRFKLNEGLWQTDPLSEYDKCMTWSLENCSATSCLIYELARVEHPPLALQKTGSCTHCPLFA